MASTTTSDSSILPPAVFPTHWTLADLQEHLGGIPMERIRLYPPIGLATVQDALRLSDSKEALCELIDGVLVEKPMGTFESLLAAALIYLLTDYLESNPLGVVTAPDGELQILPTRMRMPDVAFIRWDRFPDGKLPQDRVYKVAPNLAVEILSEGNTEQEMEQKLDEYFEAGVRLVWYIDPRPRTARLYTARQQMTTIDTGGNLDGGDVLPGFKLRLGELFDRADRRQQPST